MEYVFTEKDLRVIEIGWAAVLSFTLLFEHGVMVYEGIWSMRWSLPLQLCSLSGLLAIYTLLSGKKTVFLFLLFWGLSGGVHSIITPEMTLGDAPSFVIIYYIWHASVILVPIYFFKIKGWRLPKHSFLKVWGWSHVLWLLVGSIDWAIGANYMYVMEPPNVENPFVQGGFPNHLLVFELAGILHFGLIAILFKRWEHVLDNNELASLNPRQHQGPS